MKRVLISDVGSALYFVQSFLKNLSFLSYCKAQMEEFVQKHLERAIQIPPQLSSFMVILLLMDVKEVRPRKRRVWSSRGENRDLCLVKELYRKARLGYPEERFLIRRAQRTDSSVHEVVHPAGARVQACGTQGWEGLAKGRDPHSQNSNILKLNVWRGQFTELTSPIIPQDLLFWIPGITRRTILSPISKSVLLLLRAILFLIFCMPKKRSTHLSTITSSRIVF